jgi:hypothetical protein
MQQQKQDHAPTPAAENVTSTQTHEKGAFITLHTHQASPEDPDTLPTSYNPSEAVPHPGCIHSMPGATMHPQQA